MLMLMNSYQKRISIRFILLSFLSCTESCDSEVTATTRGSYTWPRTAADNEAELECQLGPAAGVAMEAAIGRRRCNTSGEWEDPQLENCITMVALQLQQLQEELDNTVLQNLPNTVLSINVVVGEKYICPSFITSIQ